MPRRRAKGEGRVLWRASRGHYTIRYQTPDGIVHERGRRQWTTLSAANAALAELIATLTAPPQPPADASTTAAYLASWLADKAVQVRPRTLTAYTHHVRLWAPLIGHIPLVTLTPRHIQTGITRLVTPPPAGLGYAPSTVIRARTTLLTALNDAEAMELVRRNPARGTRPPRDERPEPAAMEIEEAQRILQSVKGTRLHAAVTLALCYGLRINEVCGLRWDAVSEGEIRIAGQLSEDRRSLVPTKTRRSTRVLPLVPPVVEALAATPRPGAHIVTDTRGRPLHRNGLYELWKRHQAREGQPRRTFHELRHGAVSLLMALGIAESVAMAIVGHSNLATHRHYQHITADQIARALSRHAAALSGDSLQ